MWSRVKAGKPVNTKPDSPIALSRLSASSDSGDDRPVQNHHRRPAAREPLLSREGKLLRPPFPDALEPADANGPKPPSPRKDPSSVSHSGSARSKETRNHEVRESQDTTSGPGQQDNQPSPWLAEILKNWKNPVFAPVQPPIPQAHDGGIQTTCGLSSLTTPLQSRISRSALQSAEVISQVDKKFILAKLPAQHSTPSLLILIDQHAADERCRLEELTRSYFSASGQAESEPLEEPLRFEVPRRDAALLLRYRAFFSRWGIGYAAGRADVTVLALPPSILERCRQEPRLLIALLRAEIWRLDERGASGVERAPEGGSDWIRLFHGCPAGILDLLNSRACRSK